MEVELYDFDEYDVNANLEYMLECVNKHDVLVEEVERLKNENEKLREALKKCNPFTPSTGSRGYLCEFCIDNPHTEDCEYLKLTEVKDA